MAAKRKTAIEEGVKAPAFAAVDHEGRPFGSKDLKGKSYVLWFFPKADTSG